MFRSAYSGAVRVVSVPGDDGMTKQSMKAECDINNIVSRYRRTGSVSHIAKAKPEFGFAPAVDLMAALETVRRADSMFSELPAVVRKRFDNDPAVFLDFVQNPANIEEMYTLGLAERKAPVPPAPGATDPVA